jgi:hypothetical protein
MKVNFECFLNFNQHLVQWEAKSSLHEAFEDYHFISFEKRNSALSLGPHYRNIMKIFALHRFDLPLRNS